MHFLIAIGLIWAYFVWRKIRKAMIADEIASRPYRIAQAKKNAELEGIIIAIKREELVAWQRHNGGKQSPLIGRIP